MTLACFHRCVHCWNYADVAVRTMIVLFSAISILGTDTVVCSSRM